MGRKIISSFLIAALTASFALFIMAPKTAYAAIAFDAASSGQVTGATLTFSHTVGSGSNRILIVGVSVYTNSKTIDSVTYGGTSLTRIGSTQLGPGSAQGVGLWYLLAPTSGTANVVVTLSGSTRQTAGAVSFTGVNQSTPLGTSAGANGTSASPSVNVSSATGEVVVDVLGTNGAASSVSVGGGQTQRWNLNTGTGSSDEWGAGSAESGASSVAMSWTLGASQDWAILAVPIKPVITVSGTAGADTTWIKGGTTGKNIVFTVNNSGSSEGAVQWVKFTRPSSNYTITAGSASGWSAAVSGGSTVTFTGGSIAIGGSGTFTVTTDVASADEARTAWTVEIDNNTSGANKVTATESSANALKTGIDSTAPSNVSVSSVSADSDTQLTANAATASDSGSGLNSAPYWFDETTGHSGGSDSESWQASTAWVDTGLSASTQYCYRVKARDAVLNESAFSSTACQTTTSTPPSPDSTPPAAVSNLAAGSPTSNSIYLTWTAPGDDGGTGTATTYDVRYSTAAITEGNWASATQASGEPAPQVAGSSESFTVAGLATSTTYYFALKTSDEVPNTSAISNVPSATTSATADTTPPSISSVNASGLTQTSALITWTTDEAADSQVEYGLTTEYGSETTLDVSLVTSHSVPISGLSANTYHYRVKSRDSAGNLATSGDATFVISSASQPPGPGGDSSAPFESDVKVEVTTSTAAITWFAQEPVIRRIEYGPTLNFGSTTPETTVFTSGYSEQALGNLLNNKKYYFRIHMKDIASNSAVSKTYDFTTKKIAVPKAEITDLKTESVRPTSASVSWTTQVPATSQLTFGSKSGELSSLTIEKQTLTTNHSVSISDLSPKTTYFFRAISRNALGVETISSESTFQTESLEIQTVVDVSKPAAARPGSPGTQVPSIAAGETVTAVPIQATPGDTLAPEITLLRFTENPTENTSPTIRGRAADAKGVIAGISYSSDGGASWHPITEVEGIGSSVARFSAKIINLGDGNYPILFRVRDNSNNTGKSQTEVLIVDRQPPTTGPNVLLLGRQSLLPSSTGLFSTIAGLTHRVIVSASGGATTVQVIVTKAGSAEPLQEKAFPLMYSKNVDLWFGDIQINEPGLYDLVLRAEDGTKKVSQTAINSIFVEKPGKVVDAEKQAAISGAKVSVYQYSPDDYNYVLWPGEVFNQANPQITGDDGFYRFILPPGKYYLKVEASGFRSVSSDVFELAGHEAISLTIPLSKVPGFSINLPFFKNVKFSLPNLPEIVGISYASSKAAEAAVPEKISALIGKPAPVFSLPDLNGEMLDIRNLRGKKVIVTSWASWAPLAQVQIPILDQLQREEREDTRVLLISPHLSADIVNTYLRRGNYDLASVIDEEGKFGKLYPVLTIPEHFFIDRRGVLRDIHVGLLDSDGFKEKLSELQ